MVAETGLYWLLRSFRHGNVIFRNWSASELNGFFVFLENDNTDLRKFFQDLGENTCSLQSAVKNAFNISCSIG